MIKNKNNTYGHRCCHVTLIFISLNFMWDILGQVYPAFFYFIRLILFDISVTIGSINFLSFGKYEASNTK